MDLFNDKSNITPNGRRPNFAPKFIADFSARLKLAFVPDGCGDLHKTFGPKNIFHSPTYRSHYADFLKIDFPCLPLTSDVALFRSLCASGKELVTIHLMEQLPKPRALYPVADDNTVNNVHYSEPTDTVPGGVWINKKQHFDNVPPKVGGYHIGGYQVCHK
ncbi:MAG: hypothetical protein DID92_2727743388 [Candidatus Nitrotoga sp. SPKER]|nr:MAG: hypothetical protein DID92_2727743388 [Candidatus Nitrotoga sp. SPKER]